MASIETSALRVRQPGAEFYVFSISGKRLLELSRVSRRHENSTSGIQRVLKKSRLKKIGKFIDRLDSMFPNSIILSIDDPTATFTPEDPTGTRGILRFSADRKCAVVVDGQHRLHGFGESQCDFDLIAVALLNGEPELSAKLFYTINKEAKRLDPNLSYDLLDVIGPGINLMDYQLHRVTKRLNDDADSPFRGTIRMVDQGDGLLTQAAVINKMRGFTKTDQGLLFMTDASYVDEEGIAKLMKLFFSVVKRLQPEAWNSEDHLLTKGVGFGALMKLLPQVVQTLVYRNEKVSEDSFKKVLQPLEELDFSNDGEFAGFQGEQGMSKIADAIAQDLDLLRAAEILEA